MTPLFLLVPCFSYTLLVPVLVLQVPTWLGAIISFVCGWGNMSSISPAQPSLGYFVPCPFKLSLSFKYLLGLFRPSSSFSLFYFHKVSTCLSCIIHLSYVLQYFVFLIVSQRLVKSRSETKI